jgi:hypothetical protein
MTEPPNTHDLGSWHVRRMFMFATIAFCMGCVTYVMINDRKGGVNEMIVVMAFGTIATTMGSYVFNATWENIRSIQSSRRGRDDYYHRNSGRIEDPEPGGA